MRKREHKRLPATYVLWTLLVYAIIVVYAYTVWSDRCNIYEASVKRYYAKRQKLFKARIERPYRASIETLKERLRKQLDREKASGSNLTISEGILIPDLWSPLVERNKFLCYAHKLGVTKAIFELPDGNFSPDWTVKFNLIAEAPPEATADNPDILTIELSDKTIKVGGREIELIHRMYLSDWRAVEAIKSSKSSHAVIHICGQVNGWQLFPYLAVLNHSGIKPMLVVGSNNPQPAANQR